MAKKLISSLYKDFYAYSTNKNNPHKVTLAQIGTMSEDEINALATNYLEASPIGVGNITTLGMKFFGVENGSSFKITGIKGVVNGIPIDWVGEFNARLPTSGINLHEIVIKYRQEWNQIVISLSEITMSVSRKSLANERNYGEDIPIFRLIVRDGVIKKILSRPTLRTVNGKVVSVANIGMGIPASDANSEVSW